MQEELFNWLNNNKITFEVIDDEVVNIPEFGKMLICDMSSVNSIFRTDAEGNIKFNMPEVPQELINEEIFYVGFQFGDNWFYFDVRQEFKMNILKYVGIKQPYTLKHSSEFVNLGVHTPFELLNGSFAISEWVKKAKFLGQKALGICDYNTMGGTLILQKECKAAGITPIMGYSLTFKYEEDKVGAKVYCQSQKGMNNLLRIQKAINVDSDDKMIDLKELLYRGEGNVLVFDKYSSEWLNNNIDKLPDFEKAFEYILFQVDFSEYKAERIDIKVLQSQKLYFDKLYGTIAPILIQDCYYLDKSDYKNKIILNKIESGAAHEQSDDQYFKDMDEHYTMFEKILNADKWDIQAVFEECCQNTVKIANGAKAKYSMDRNFMPEYMLTPEEKVKYGTRHNMFLTLLDEGFERLVPKGKEEEYRKRLDKEIYILESTNNIDYMLVQYDTVNWARKNDIMVGCGRGSAGGSLILYLLGITLIDPMKFSLIFERFLLPERAGLYPSDTTIIGNDIESQHYFQITLENGRTYTIDKDAELLVQRPGTEKPIILYADELQENDDIIFDNRDLLFTLNEI